VKSEPTDEKDGPSEPDKGQKAHQDPFVHARNVRTSFNRCFSLLPEADGFSHHPTVGNWSSFVGRDRTLALLVLRTNTKRRSVHSVHRNDVAWFPNKERFYGQVTWDGRRGFLPSGSDRLYDERRKPHRQSTGPRRRHLRGEL
jgi:hypothetical protein